MGVIRVQKHQNNFVILDRTCLGDARLSFKSKGLHAYLCSQPDNWKISLSKLQQQTPHEGRDSLAAGLHELLEHRYASRRRLRNVHGKMMGWETIVFESPFPLEYEHPKSVEPTEPIVMHSKNKDLPFPLADAGVTDNGLADVGLADVGLTDVGDTDNGLADVGLAVIGESHTIMNPRASPSASARGFLNQDPDPDPDPDPERSMSGIYKNKYHYLGAGKKPFPAPRRCMASQEDATQSGKDGMRQGTPEVSQPMSAHPPLGIPIEPVHVLTQSDQSIDVSRPASSLREHSSTVGIPIKSATPGIEISATLETIDGLSPCANSSIPMKHTLDDMASPPEMYCSSRVMLNNGIPTHDASQALSLAITPSVTPETLPEDGIPIAKCAKTSQKAKVHVTIPVTEEDWPGLRLAFTLFDLPFETHLDDNDWWNAMSYTCGGIPIAWLKIELARMEAWIRENPRRGPTTRWKTFVRGWLERAYEQKRRQLHG